VYSGQLCLSKRCSFLFMKVTSGRLEGIVLSVIMLLFQYGLKLSFSSTLAGVYLQYGLLSSINSAAYASFQWITFATLSFLFIYSVGANCSHAAVMCWIVSDSFPHLLHSSSVFGCLKIHFLLFLVIMTWSCIAYYYYYYYYCYYY
jgi:hypothetical protein